MIEGKNEAVPSTSSDLIFCQRGRTVGGGDKKLQKKESYK